MTGIWDELRVRVRHIRELCRGLKIELILGQGLAQSLDEAEELAEGKKHSAPANEADLLAAVRAFHNVWALYDSLDSCQKAGLPIAAHLKQMTTGSADFGVPSEPSSAFRMIYYKDFEAELFVAASLARAGLPVKFLEEHNDPRGDMLVQDVFIEVKHPNSAKSLERLMRKFDGQMRRTGSAGVFVAALEDAFRMGSPTSFSSNPEFLSWKERKDDEVEVFGIASLLQAATLQNIGVLAQTSSYIEIVGDETRFVRRSNAVMYDERSYASTVNETLKSIAAVFNPHPTFFSEVRTFFTAR
jgi:hypothetical protein